MDNPILLYGVAGVMAIIPAIIWLSLIFKKTEKRSLQTLIFLGSTLSVVPIFLLQYLFNIFPEFNIVEFFQHQVHNQNANYVILFIWVGITEEIVKQILIRIIDKRYLLIQTINDSIRYSLIGAMGFAFAENIFYIVSIYLNAGIQSLIVPYLFRSLFTTAAHLIFSGFFGYFYGIAKFSLNIVEQSRWTGKKHRVSNSIARIFNISRIQAFKELTILRGLFVAIILHAIFNFLLQLNQVLPVVVYVIAGAGLLLHTLRQKTGKLILITDATEKRSSNMAKTDEDVVIELLGMWFKSNRYVDVLHICQRLLERDPDNKVVQLFKARAADKMNAKSPYAKILANIFPPSADTKSIHEMVMKKAETGAKSPIAKESKEMSKPQENLAQPVSSKPTEPTKEQLKPEESDDGTFKLNI